MLRSLYSGVSGLRTHQIKMDVIGNNIANVNTTAFKASRVTFKDVYYQTVAGATAKSDAKGGSNAKQIGIGSTTSTIDVNNSPSGFQATDIGLDLYIAGDGYFMVKDGADATKYTRAGVFGVDGEGNLVDANGNYVCDSSGSPIVIDPAYTDVTVGKDGTISGIKDGVIEPSIGQIGLSKFGNPNGLAQDGGTYFIETNNSGTRVDTTPGKDGTGNIVAGGLEMSNVDLSKELTDMITTERGFQANSRVITVSDEILQELVNLKR